MIWIAILNAEGQYAQALEFLYGRLNFERTDAAPHHTAIFKLDRMRELLAELGHPESHAPIVHVAGTKGKGSTAGFVSNMASAAGYRVGCYTSPHLLRLEERFAVDGLPCSEAELVELVEAIRPAIQTLDERGDANGLAPLTFFEITTALAFLHFQRRDVQLTVLEVGLGGRLDSTNVCQPVVCIITSISFDHMRQLGNTLAAIAGEKAGIIKPQIPVITGVTQQEPLDVIVDKADECRAPLSCLGRDFDFRYRAPSSLDNSRPEMDLVRISNGRQSPIAEKLQLAALGQHQAANASLAWMACDELMRHGFTIDDDARRAGLATGRCPARIEIVRRLPTVIIDTAHNAASIQALVQVLSESFTETKRTLILAASRDKDVSGMLHRLVPEFETIVCTRYLKNPRSMATDELARHARRIATAEGAVVDILTADSPAAAWQLANATHETDHLICATGSFFLAAEMKETLEALRKAN
ncbi:MAG: bifunctional folylpolyglutamate synthase/dihydrofolate synthase [Planctomycetales bacterium]|nr:bifunctional folylpolyglutamate synthase/dihydrofolate synthase [Planctomycetales bacterium]MCA9170948.1 bifunctional folylpolyglutamate synthase/dihydrofolate synthase [Planctomycetales bacterium]